MYDAAETIALECDESFTVLGRGGEFVLIDNHSSDHSFLTTKASVNDWTYCGIIGLQDGIPRVECAPHPDSTTTMLYAALMFCRIVSDRLHNPLTGDSTRWLENLHTLQDTRGVNYHA